MFFFKVLGGFPQKMCHQKGNVVQALTQGWNVNTVGTQPVIKVFSKFTGFQKPGKIAVGGGYNAGV